MTAHVSDDLKYPIGRWSWPTAPLTEAERKEAAKNIQELPGLLNSVFVKTGASGLHLRYRPEGWTISQVIHHLADSHLNAFTRFKLTLTEDVPTVKPYKEALWAELPDVLDAPADLSLKMIEGLHGRWSALINKIQAEQWNRTYHHPEYNKEFRLDSVLALYSWHGRHHLAHVRQALEYRFT